MSLATSGQQKPNIVFILMDNLGYGEVGCYGGGILRGAPTRILVPYLNYLLVAILV